MFTLYKSPFFTEPYFYRRKSKHLRRERVAVTLGVFDGVHRGHQKIIKTLLREAVRFKTRSLVITFHPHPHEILTPHLKIPFLTSLEHRLKLLRGLGVDLFMVIRFTRSFSRVRAEDFIEKILLQRFDIKSLVVGENFLFGYKEKGSLRLLKKMSKKFNFRVVSVKTVKTRGISISSTRIRKEIEKGNLKNAANMLGRPVTVLGTVVKGRRIGRILGFPTANINPHHEAIPPSGVYSVDVRVNGVNKKNFRGILNIGIRPTFGKYKEPSIELHILNFKKDIYGRDVEIIFRRKIREERKFHSVVELREQIQRDIQRAT